VAQPIADAELAHQVVQPRLVDLAAGEIGRKFNVLLGAERRDQVERLENEADTVTSQLGEPGIVQLPDIVPANQRLPGCRAVQARHAVHERRLP